MPKHAERRAPLRHALMFSLLIAAVPASAQKIHALPDQTSHIRLSNRDINHVVCEGGEIEDIKFSAEKGVAVEKGGSDAWIKFLAHEIDDAGQITRSYVTQPSEFFVSCNGATYPLYAEPAEIPAQTVVLMPGARHQHHRLCRDLRRFRIKRISRAVAAHEEFGRLGHIAARDLPRIVDLVGKELDPGVRAALFDSDALFGGEFDVFDLAALAHHMVDVAVGQADMAGLVGQRMDLLR